MHIKKVLNSRETAVHKLQLEVKQVERQVLKSHLFHLLI